VKQAFEKVERCLTLWLNYGNAETQRLCLKRKHRLWLT